MSGETGELGVSPDKNGPKIASCYTIFTRVRARNRVKIAATDGNYSGRLHRFITFNPMYARTLRNAAHTRRFTITNTDSSGWEIREEHDSRLVKAILYDDWHRVERARNAIAREVLSLRDDGWVEA